jgi:hypothetical protein
VSNFARAMTTARKVGRQKGGIASFVSVKARGLYMRAQNRTAKQSKGCAHVRLCAQHHPRA